MKINKKCKTYKFDFKVSSKESKIIKEWCDFIRKSRKTMLMKKDEY